MTAFIGRREFITLLGGAATWPLVGPFSAYAQQSQRMPRVGLLMPYAENDPETSPRVAALRQGLQQLGWAEGRNVRLEHYQADSDADSMRKLAREVVDSRPDVLLTETTPVTAAVLHETRTTPVVFVQVADPVGSGFVTSFPHPGHNATGFNNVPLTVASKWLQLLMEIVPRTVRVMFLFHPPTAPYAQRMFESFNAAASMTGVEVVASPVHDLAELETALAAFARVPDSGLIVFPSAFMITHRDLVATLAVRYRLPAVYAFRHYVQAGGLISYGTIPADTYRQAATYLDRILRGTKPADLPVQTPAKLELIVNLKTAKAMGLTIPESFLVRADEVIE
jgi:putative ABC transport system substrate-binding protein